MLERPRPLSRPDSEPAEPPTLTMALRADTSARAARTSVVRPEIMALEPETTWAVDVSIGAWRACSAALSFVTSVEDLARAAASWVLSSAHRGAGKLGQYRRASKGSREGQGHALLIVRNRVERSDVSLVTIVPVLVRDASRPVVPPDETSCWIAACAVEILMSAVRICWMSE